MQHSLQNRQFDGPSDDVSGPLQDKGAAELRGRRPQSLGNFAPLGWWSPLYEMRTLKVTMGNTGIHLTSLYLTYSAGDHYTSIPGRDVDLLPIQLAFDLHYGRGFQNSLSKIEEATEMVHHAAALNLARFIDLARQCTDTGKHQGQSFCEYVQDVKVRLHPGQYGLDTSCQ
jgi:hypothetical protein